MTAPTPFPPDLKRDGRKRLDPGLVDLVKALARASATRDTAPLLSRKP